jgi:hypothetical protein
MRRPFAIALGGFYWIRARHIRAEPFPPVSESLVYIFLIGFASHFRLAWIGLNGSEFAAPAKLSEPHIGHLFITTWPRGRVGSSSSRGSNELGAFTKK